MTLPCVIRFSLFTFLLEENNSFHLFFCLDHLVDFCKLVSSVFLHFVLGVKEFFLNFPPCFDSRVAGVRGVLIWAKTTPELASIIKQGYEISFEETPELTLPCNETILPSEQMDIVRGEVKNLLQKGAIEVVKNPV